MMARALVFPVAALIVPAVCWLWFRRTALAVAALAGRRSSL